MKPKLFIGSSSEALNVANAIQENLNYDSDTTVWNQGVFKLSSTALQDLIKAVNTSDFAIFVFNPDDVSIIRKEIHSTVRDNVIFELGLFIGKLGQENVFYLVPESEEIHLPTDLLGIKPGTYNSKRADKNLLAALGPFCNQVRNSLKSFTYVNLTELKDESELVRTLAIEKPFAYEYLILAEMVETRLYRSRLLHQGIREGSYFVKTKNVDDNSYFHFFKETLADFSKFVEVFSFLFSDGVVSALGPNGVNAKFEDLKNFAEKVNILSLELFNWETRNEELNPPNELSQIKKLLRGASDMVNTQIDKFPDELRKVIKEKKYNPKSTARVNMIFAVPQQMKNALDIFEDYYNNKNKEFDFN